MKNLEQEIFYLNQMRKIYYGSFCGDPKVDDQVHKDLDWIEAEIGRIQTSREEFGEQLG